MDKEQIIIDGKTKDCKILFRCKHIDDLAAYNMIRNGIKITPENAPIGDFELMLIENTDSPFGFSSVCKRNNKEDVWEYSGFGHSGACSIVTALLKQLARKTQECEELKKQLIQKSEVDMFFNTPIEGWSNDPCGICPHKAENEELKKQLETSEEWRIKAESLNEKLELNNGRYRKALEEIEKVINNILNSCLGRNTVSCRPAHNVCGDLINILDIINKAKDGE